MSRSIVLSSDNSGPMTTWVRSALLARSALSIGAVVFGLLIAGLCVPTPAQAQTATRTPTPRSTLRATATVTPTLAPTRTPTLVPTATPEAPLTGTIIANRTQVSVTFFVDGRTYEAAPLRSLSIPVRRDNTVLNLYNCEAKTGADNTDCFWDPYLMRQDGFYEVIDQAATGAPVSLLLRDAAAPPGDQIWLHNRTGRETAIHYAGATYRLSPGATVEVVLLADESAVYVQHCLELAGASVCEWLPVDVVGGVYYGVNRVVAAGGAAQSRQVSTDLAPVLAQDVDLLIGSRGQVAAAPPTVGCSLAVPTLNVRAGPGVDFAILDKLRQEELGADLVSIIGRNAASSWLAVGDAVVKGGWISASSTYVTCAGTVADLPVAEVVVGTLAPTPIPQASQTQPQPAAQPQPEPEPEPTAAPQPAGPAAGQVRLVVFNAFGQEIRFTYQDQEHDMQPGQQVTIDTFPGLIAFSASSAWRNLHGNADFTALADETHVLYVRWEHNPDSGDWDMKFD